MTKKVSLGNQWLEIMALRTCTFRKMGSSRGKVNKVGIMAVNVKNIRVKRMSVTFSFVVMTLLESSRLAWP